MFALLDWLLGLVLRSQLLYFSHKCSNIGNVTEVRTSRLILKQKQENTSGGCHDYGKDDHLMSVS